MSTVNNNITYVCQVSSIDPKITYKMLTEELGVSKFIKKNTAFHVDAHDIELPRWMLVPQENQQFLIYAF